jgi:hypothetical protein
MTTRDVPADFSAGHTGAERAPWLPLVIVVLAQLQMAINSSALPVSLGPISADLDAPATAAATALLLYSLFVAAFVMLGAKIGKLVGSAGCFKHVSWFMARRWPSWRAAQTRAR